MLKKNQALTLMELLISVIVISIMVLSIYNIDLFSRKRLFNTERRTVLQNELSFALEHMSKYVALGIGDKNHPPLTAITVDPKGFRVNYIDTNNNPGDLTLDCAVTYQLSGNSLSLTTTCAPTFLKPQNLSNKIMSFTVQVKNDGTPATDGNSVNITLVGRFTPADPISTKNPEVSMQTEVICNSASTN